MWSENGAFFAKPDTLSVLKGSSRCKFSPVDRHFADLGIKDKQIGAIMQPLPYF